LLIVVAAIAIGLGRDYGNGGRARRQRDEGQRIRAFLSAAIERAKTVVSEDVAVSVRGSSSQDRLSAFEIVSAWPHGQHLVGKFDG